MYALKQVDLKGMKRVDREEAIDEARILANLDCQYITQHYESFIGKAAHATTASPAMPPFKQASSPYSSSAGSPLRGLIRKEINLDLTARFTPAWHPSEDDKLNIVMELADKGSLHAKLKAQNGRGLPEETVWKYFIEVSAMGPSSFSLLAPPLHHHHAYQTCSFHRVLSSQLHYCCHLIDPPPSLPPSLPLCPQSLLALNYLHSKKIVHRDIKTLNIFLTESGDVMVGDLGVARAMSDNTDFCRTRLGTPYYLSPELCEDKPYNEKSDVWALGVVLYEMCMAVHPFTAENEGALIRKIMRGVYVPISGYSVQMADMVKTCLTYDYRRRPDTNVLLRHPTIQSKAASLRISLKPTPRKRIAAAPKAPPPPQPPSPEPQHQHHYQQPPPDYHYQQYQEHPGQPYEYQQPPPQQHRTPPGRSSPVPVDMGGWPEPAPPPQQQDWPGPAAPYPRPADLAAQNRRGAGGVLPGGPRPVREDAAESSSAAGAAAAAVPSRGGADSRGREAAARRSVVRRRGRRRGSGV